MEVIYWILCFLEGIFVFYVWTKVYKLYFERYDKWLGKVANFLKDKWNSIYKGYALRIYDASLLGFILALISLLLSVGILLFVVGIFFKITEIILF